MGLGVCFVNSVANKNGSQLNDSSFNLLGNWGEVGGGCGVTPGGTQGLLLALCSRVTFNSVQGTMWGQGFNLSFLHAKHELSPLNDLFGPLL